MVTTTYVALLRAVNVAGRNQVAMPGLCACLSRLGLQDVRSLLQSGNVVFRSGASSTPAQLERLLEREAAARLGLTTDFFVRTPAEWRALVAANPFPGEADRDPSHVLVVFLKEAPKRETMRALEQAVSGRERVAVRDRHLYVVYPDGIGRSRLTGTLIERTLGTRGTARNWNTVMRLGALADTVSEG
jgi:uncharacterized protein (DUF1697 family)